MANTFPAMVAWDPTQNLVVKNAQCQVYAQSDTGLTAPLAILDHWGNPVAGNILNSGDNGILPEFQQAANATVVVADSTKTYKWTLIAVQPPTQDTSVAGFVNTATSATAGGLRASFAGVWQPNTAYTAGQQALDPNTGALITAAAAFTSTGTFAPANWNYHTTTTIVVAPPTGVAATDTANIQNALNQSTSANPKRIILQSGTYQINAALSMPFAPGTQVTGQGRFVTTIQQNTAGVPIFSFTQNLTHSITIERMTVQFSGTQTNSGSVAFFYDVAGGTGSGFYHHLYRDLWVGYCYDGFKLADTDGAQTLWNTTWENVIWGSVARSAVRFAPASAIGIPELNFINCLVDCTPTVTQSGAGNGAFVFNGCEVQFTGIGIEQWNDQAFYISGGGHLTIRNLHVETHHFTAANSYFANIQGSSVFEVDGFAISGANTSGNTSLLVLFAPSGGNSTITLRNGYHNVTTSAGAAYVTEVMWGGSGVTNLTLRTEGVTKAGGGLNNPLQGSRGNQVAEYSPAQLARQYRSVVANAPTTLAASAVGSGGTFTAGTYYYVVTNTIPQGTETVASNEVSVALVANGSASLTWTNGSGATGVKVYRGTAAGAENILVATLGVVTSYTDTNSGSAGTPPTTTTYNQQQFDGTIVAQGTSVTVKLLDPTTCVVGQPVTVKNTGANAVTVNSAGTSKTIDGAASTTLAQWAKGTYLSDGTQWLSV